MEEIGARELSGEMAVSALEGNGERKGWSHWGREGKERERFKKIVCKINLLYHQYGIFCYSSYVVTKINPPFNFMACDLIILKNSSFKSE